MWQHGPFSVLDFVSLSHILLNVVRRPETDDCPKQTACYHTSTADIVFLSEMDVVVTCGVAELRRTKIAGLQLTYECYIIKIASKRVS